MSDVKSKKWTYEQLKGAAIVLNPQTGTNKYASQKGMTGFGMPRSNISKSKDLGYITPDKRGDDFLRLQCGTNVHASQKGHTAISAFRPNIPRVAYKDGMTEGSEKETESIMTLQAGTNRFASQSGEVVIGSRRNQLALVRGRMPNDRRCQGFIPFQSGTNVFASQTGMHDAPGIGAYRQATTEYEGLNFTEEMIRKHGINTPWFAGTNKFATQRGSGGFLKCRDVISKMTGGKEISEEFLRKCEGVLRLQSGTNKLASQRGMTGYGTPRPVVGVPKWKQEWIEEWQEAEKEFEESGRGRQHQRDPLTGALIVPKKVPESTVTHEAEIIKEEEDEGTHEEEEEEEEE
jgi:hypothetical protein